MFAAGCFRDRVAIVTGAASGIGAALSEALAARGALVVLTDRQEERVKARASTLQSSGLRVFARAVDVTNQHEVTLLIEETRAAHGRLDYLFNNAGLGLAGEFRDTSLEDWQRIFEVNLWGVVHGIQAAYPLMISQGSGHIVNTASGAGLAPRPGMAAYAASKHAIVGLSTSLRAEAAGLGVKVSAVCPGYIQSNILESTTYKNLDSQSLVSSIPISPMSAEDCARVILKGVLKNKAIITVTRVAWLDWWLYRLFPALSIRLAEIRLSKFRAHRKTGER